MSEINLDDLEQVKDEGGNVLGYIHEDEVLNEDYAVIGGINADGDVELFEAEEFSPEEAEAEAEDEAEDEAEYTADADGDGAIDMDVVDNYIDVLHQRGMELMDPATYPSDEFLELVKKTDEEEHGTQEILREIMDGLKDQIDIKDLDTIKSFGKGRSVEIDELADARIEAGKKESFFSTEVDSLRKHAEKLKDDDIFSKVKNFADSAAGNAVDFVKENPGKAAAGAGVGALALITGPFIAAGAGAAALFGGKLFKNKKNQAEDSLRLEAAALADELKKMEKDGVKAFEKLEEAEAQLGTVPENEKLKIAKGLKAHRRTSLYLGVMSEVERRVIDEVLPGLKAKAEEEKVQTGDISDDTSATIDLVNAAIGVISGKVESLNVSHARGVIMASRARARLGSLARVDMKISDHLTETRLQWKQNIADSYDSLRFSAILEAADDMDQLSDNMQIASDDMEMVNAKLLNRTTGRAAVDPKLLIESLKTTKATNLLLEGKSTADSKASRLLLNAAVKDLNETDDQAREKKLLPPSNKLKKAKSKTSEQDNKGPKKLKGPQVRKTRVIKRNGPK